MPPSDPHPDSANVLAHARWMAALARHLATGDSGSDDLVQETWLAYLEKPPRSREATGSWLRSVLRNFALRSRRSEKRRRAREESNARPEAQPQDPADIVERAELLQRISQLVLNLDEPHRSTVLLRYFEDRSPTEIARSQGVPVNTVYTRLRRALEELRGQLDQQHGGRRGAWLAVLAPLALAPLAAPAAAAASASTSCSAISKLALGGIPLASKKLGLAAAISACLFLVVGGLIIWSHSTAHRASLDGENIRTASEREPRERADRTALEDSAKPPIATTSPSSSADPLAASKPPLLRGRVLDAQRNGIEEASIVAVPLRTWEEITAAEFTGVERRRDGDVSNELAAIFHRLRAAARQLPRCSSGVGGEFRFDALSDGEHRLLAWRDGFLPSTSTIVLIASSQTATSDLELLEAQAIRGQVVDEDRRPVAGAVVRSRQLSWRLLTDDGRRAEILELLGEATFLAKSNDVETGSDGSFALPSLEPGLHDLQAVKSGMGRAALFDVPAGSRDVQIVLVRGFTVTGVVQRPERIPVGGAEVTLGACAEKSRAAAAVGESPEATVSADILFEGDRAARSTTDAQGRFRLSGVSVGRHLLAIRTSAFPTLSRDITVREAMDLGVLELKPGGAIAGIVVDSGGGPIVDARLWIEDVPVEGVSEWGGRFHAPGVLIETRTRLDGLFRLDGLSDGAYSLHVASAVRVERTLSSVRPGREDLRIELAEGFAARGRVVDGATGAPLPGARISLKQGLWGIASPEKSVESGQDGGFELRGLARGDEKLSIEATHPAYSGEKASTELRLDGRSSDMVLRLHRPEPLSGRVVDTAGQPVAFARITCTIAGVEACRSDEEGAFVLMLPRAARNYEWFEVAASRANPGSGRVVVEKPADGKLWPDVTIGIQAGSTLKGKVRSSKGDPIPRAVVKVSRLPGQGKAGSGPLESAYSGEDGTYSFSRLERGSYRLEAQALGFVRSVVESVEVGEVTPDQDFALEPGRKATGRVLNQDGQPVSSAEVVALETLDLDTSKDFGTSPTRSQRRRQAAGIASARTDATGLYELRDLPPSRVTLVARAAAHEPSPLVVVNPDEPVEDLVVTALGGITGTVVDAASGQPLSFFTVWIRRKEQGDDDSEREFLPRDYDDPRGIFRFEALPAGRYAVAVTVASRPVSGQWVDIPHGEDIQVRFPVEVGMTLTGLVKDVDGGAPLAGAQVRAFAFGGWTQQLMVPSPGAWTGIDGTFRLDGLSAEQHQVHASLSGYARKQKTIKLEEGVELQPIEIELRRCGKLEGRLTNLPKRKSFGGSLLFHRLDETGKEDQNFPVSAWEESFAIDGIRPGRYEVQLREEVAGPNVAPGATAFKREDMIERTLQLGEVEIRAGETTRLDATLPVEPPGGK